MNMKTIKTESQRIFSSCDDYGKFEVRIQNNCSQIQMENSFDSCFINVSIREIREIIKMFQEAINEFENK